MAPSVPGSGALASSAGPAGRGCAVDPGGPVGICDPDGSGGIVGSSGGLLENAGGSVVGVGGGPGAVGLLDGAGGEAAGPGVAAPDGLAGPSSARSTRYGDRQDRCSRNQRHDHPAGPAVHPGSLCRPVAVHHPPLVRVHALVARARGRVAGMTPPPDAGAAPPPAAREPSSSTPPTRWARSVPGSRSRTRRWCTWTGTRWDGCR